MCNYIAYILNMIFVMYQTAFVMFVVTIGLTDSTGVVSLNNFLGMCACGIYIIGGSITMSRYFKAEFEAANKEQLCVLK